MFKHFAPVLLLLIFLLPIANQAQKWTKKHTQEELNLLTLDLILQEKLAEGAQKNLSLRWEKLQPYLDSTKYDSLFISEGLSHSLPVFKGGNDDLFNYLHATLFKVKDVPSSPIYTRLILNEPLWTQVHSFVTHD